MERPTRFEVGQRYGGNDGRYVFHVTEVRADGRGHLVCETGTDNGWVSFSTLAGFAFLGGPSTEPAAPVCKCGRQMRAAKSFLRCDVCQKMTTAGAGDFTCEDDDCTHTLCAAHASPPPVPAVEPARPKPAKGQRWRVVGGATAHPVGTVHTLDRPYDHDPRAGWCHTPGSSMYWPNHCFENGTLEYIDDGTPPASEPASAKPKAAHDVGHWASIDGKTWVSVESFQQRGHRADYPYERIDGVNVRAPKAAETPPVTNFVAARCVRCCGFHAETECPDGWYNRRPATPPAVREAPPREDVPAYCGRDLARERVIATQMREHGHYDNGSLLIDQERARPRVEPSRRYPVSNDLDQDIEDVR